MMNEIALVSARQFQDVPEMVGNPGVGPMQRRRCNHAIYRSNRNISNLRRGREIKTLGIRDEPFDPHTGIHGCSAMDELFFTANWNCDFPSIRPPAIFQ